MPTPKAPWTEALLQIVEERGPMAREKLLALATPSVPLERALGRAEYERKRSWERHRGEGLPALRERGERVRQLEPDALAKIGARRILNEALRQQVVTGRLILYDHKGEEWVRSASQGKIDVRRSTPWAREILRLIQQNGPVRADAVIADVTPLIPPERLLRENERKRLWGWQKDRKQGRPAIRPSGERLVQRDLDARLRAGARSMLNHTFWTLQRRGYLVIEWREGERWLRPAEPERK